MTAKPPMSKLAIGFYVIGACWLVASLLSLRALSHMNPVISPSATMGYAITTIGSGLLYAILTIMVGKVVQMIFDIRWKMFEGNQNA